MLFGTLFLQQRGMLQQFQVRGMRRILSNFPEKPKVTISVVLPCIPVCEQQIPGCLLPEWLFDLLQRLRRTDKLLVIQQQCAKQ